MRPGSARGGGEALGADPYDRHPEELPLRARPGRRPGDPESWGHRAPLLAKPAARRETVESLSEGAQLRASTPHREVSAAMKLYYHAGVPAPVSAHHHLREAGLRIRGSRRSTCAPRRRRPAWTSTPSTPRAMCHPRIDNGAMLTERPPSCSTCLDQAPETSSPRPTAPSALPAPGDAQPSPPGC